MWCKSQYVTISWNARTLCYSMELLSDARKSSENHVGGHKSIAQMYYFMLCCEPGVHGYIFAQKYLISLYFFSSHLCCLFWYRWHADFCHNRKCRNSLVSQEHRESVWSRPRTRVVQVTQHFVILSSFPRHCRWLLLCSSNSLFLWDCKSLFPILSHWDKSKK